ncbi:MAG: 23S rRNA (guanosine(2251)-2'-O)-methyltransferase RlmB [Bacteroidota bacterium]
MARETMIYGVHPVMEALEAGKEIDKVLIQLGLRSEHSRDLIKMLDEREVPYQTVPIQKLNRLTGKNHQGIIAFISAVEYIDIEKLLPILFEEGKNPFLLVLDRITDVRNFGALARTAECAGVNAIIIPSRGSAQINEDAIKTSSGALMNVPVCRAPNLKNTLRFLRESGLQVVAVTEKAKDEYYEIDLSTPTALILGSEEDGISDAYLRLSDQQVRIPLLGEVLSLNVSVAGGVLMYEVVKQRLTQS